MAEVVGLSVGGLLGSIASAAHAFFAKLQEFIHRLFEIVVREGRKLAQWYMNLWSRDPDAAMTLTLIVAYWLWGG
jgi:hypothetical protein